MILPQKQNDTKKQPFHNMHANNFFPQRIQRGKIRKKSENKYFASIGLIGIPGIIDKVDDENPRPLFMREGTIKSCQSQGRNIHLRKLLPVKHRHFLVI